MLRGHIRDSFNDDRLYRLLKQIHEDEDIQIYIHTWNIIQSNISWRNIRKDDHIVDEYLIKNYFRDIAQFIKNITIDDDANLPLIGTTHGNVSSTRCPKIGWKNMWYGKKRLIDNVKEDIVNMDEKIINMRFDIFTNSNGFPYNLLLQFTKNATPITRNLFLHDHEFQGLDNIYIGNLNTMFNLIYHFHYNLDDILQKNIVGNQEYLVFRENKLIYS